MSLQIKAAMPGNPSFYENGLQDYSTEGLQKLKEAGVGKIYLYITHCENTIYEGELLKNNGLIEKIYTTDTILTNLESPKIELVERFR